jgi:hypothetical protein
LETLKIKFISTVSSQKTTTRGPFRLPISITEIGHRSDFNPLKSVTCPISADREFSIEIGSVADLKFKNFEIVNKATNHVDFI